MALSLAKPTLSPLKANASGDAQCPPSVAAHMAAMVVIPILILTVTTRPSLMAPRTVVFTPAANLPQSQPSKLNLLSRRQPSPLSKPRRPRLRQTKKPLKRPRRKKDKRQKRKQRKRQRRRQRKKQKRNARESQLRRPEKLTKPKFTTPASTKDMVAQSSTMRPTTYAWTTITMASATLQEMRAARSTSTTMVSQIAKTKTVMLTVTHQNTFMTLTISMTTSINLAGSAPTTMVPAGHTWTTTATHPTVLAATAA